MSPIRSLLGAPEPAIISPPPIIPPAPMPSADDDAVKQARRRALARQYSRRGRRSTILSEAVSDSETLGG